MKAVVATSRMHESSKRRTDSCEGPGPGNPRQSSLQQDPAPEPGGGPTVKESPPEEKQPPHSKSGSSDSSPPPAPKAAGPPPTRPPLRAGDLQHVSIDPKTTSNQTPLAQKSSSMVDPSSKIETMSLLAGPPSPDSLSNGLAGPETARKTPHRQ